jgi:hypothetical protein
MTHAAITRRSLGEVRSQAEPEERGKVCVDRNLLRPLAHLNFGHAPRYEIQPKSLVETYAAKFGASSGPPAVE